jgi:spore maturation protein CgeB
MKLVIFGLTVSSSWGNGHATLWRGLCRALAEQKHQVVFFERDVPYYAEHRDLHQLPGGDLRLYSQWEDNLSAARRELADADVAMVTSFCPDGLAATELVLSSPARLKTFYDLDTPVTLDCLQSGKPVSYIGPRGFADFDVVLSYTGGRALQELKSQLGAKRVAPLYGHVDPDVHYRVAVEPQFSCDLSYLGTYAADRQPTLETLFIEPARVLPNRRFLIGGAQYPAEFPWTDNIFFVRHVEPSRHPAFYSSSRITVNVTRRAMKEMGYCPSGRLFEAAACGTPILSDMWEGLDQFFTFGEELLVARTSEEAIRCLEISDDELRQLGERARERVLSEHTSAHRARELESIFEAALSEGATEDALGRTNPQTTGV